MKLALQCFGRGRELDVDGLHLFLLGQRLGSIQRIGWPMAVHANQTLAPSENHLTNLTESMRKILRQFSTSWLRLICGRGRLHSGERCLKTACGAASRRRWESKRETFGPSAGILRQI